MTKSLRIFGFGLAAVLGMGIGQVAAGEVVIRSNAVGGDAFTHTGPNPPRDKSQAIGATGWNYANVRVGGTVGIDGTYRDPNPTTGSTGSVHFKGTDGNAKADVELYAPLGRLGDLTSLSYDWYRSGASAATAHLHPTLRLIIQGSQGIGYLIFERVYNAGTAGPAPSDTWTHEDLFHTNPGTAGNPTAKMWVNGTEVFSNTLSDYINLDPAQTLAGNRFGFSEDSLIVGLSSGIGSGWGSFDGGVDNIGIGFNGLAPTAYNFEVQGVNPVPEPSSLLMGGTCAALGLGLAALRNRKKRPVVA
ncbi:hypothetical protein EP7_002685 [Isosphaeraceae bacterium EP7]